MSRSNATSNDVSTGGSDGSITHTKGDWLSAVEIFWPVSEAWILDFRAEGLMIWATFPSSCRLWPRRNFQNVGCTFAHIPSCGCTAVSCQVILLCIFQLLCNTLINNWWLTIIAYRSIVYSLLIYVSDSHMFRSQDRHQGHPIVSHVNGTLLMILTLACNSERN